MTSSLPKPIDFTTTIAAAGDTWDMLALDYYDDELLASLIIFHNPKLAEILVFDEAVEVTIPLIDQQASGALPPWRSNDA